LLSAMYTPIRKGMPTASQASTPTAPGVTRAP
jgi:hypothetical protein